MTKKHHRNSFTLRSMTDPWLHHTGHRNQSVNINHCNSRGKIALVTEQHTTTYWGNGDKAPRIPNLCTRLNRVQGEIRAKVIK
jgi:hypothetical protein